MDNKDTSLALQTQTPSDPEAPKQESETKQSEENLSVAVISDAREAANPSNLISISIGVKYGEAGPCTNLNFAFDPDSPQDLII